MSVGTLRRFKTLSQAVLAGSGQAMAPIGALKAAWAAQFRDGKDFDPLNSAALQAIYPELAAAAGPLCPFGPQTICPSGWKHLSQTLEQAILHLENVHNLGPESIARWLAAQGY